MIQSINPQDNRRSIEKAESSDTLTVSTIKAGAITEGGIEAYRQSQTGAYNWRQILIKTLGGSLKGAIAASPLNFVGTGLGVGGIGAIEEYLYCKENGESHEQAMRSAMINGSLECVTAGTFKWIGNTIAQRKAMKAQSRLKTMSDAELQATWGGARDPKWRPRSKCEGSLRTPQESGISISDEKRIQNAANRTKQDIVVVGSRANGTATANSDWDYIMSGKSSQRHSAASSIPRGTSGGEINSSGRDTGIDIFTNNPNSSNYQPLDLSKPHVIFSPKT